MGDRNGAERWVRKRGARERHGRCRGWDSRKGWRGFGRERHDEVMQRADGRQETAWRGTNGVRISTDDVMQGKHKTQSRERRWERVLDTRMPVCTDNGNGHTAAKVLKRLKRKRLQALSQPKKGGNR